MHWLPVDNHAVRADEEGDARVPFSIRTKHACGASRHQLEMQSGPLSWHPGWGRGAVRGTGDAVVWWDSRVNVIALWRSQAASPGPRPPSNLDTSGRSGPSGLQWGGLILSTTPSSLSPPPQPRASVYWSRNSYFFKKNSPFIWLCYQIGVSFTAARWISERKFVGRGRRRTHEGNV